MSSTAKLWETDTPHTLVGVQDGPSPTEKDVGISGQITYVFTFGSSHPTTRNLLEIRKCHSHEFILCWIVLLKIHHDSQHTQQNHLAYKCRSVI